jgi:competence protein ComEC
MLERPLLIPLASLIAGLCAADITAASPPEWALGALVATTLAASLVRSHLPFLLSLSLLFAVWGGVSLAPFLYPTAAILGHLTEEPVVIEGVLDRRPERGSFGGSRVYLAVEQIYRQDAAAPVTGRLLVNVQEGRVELATGDRVLVKSKIRKPRNLGLPWELNYERKLAYQGIFATAFVKSADDVVLVSSGAGWRHRVDLLAARLGRFVMRSAPGVEGGVLKALLLGDRGDIPQELNDAYARSGVSHILSISGFHVSIIFLTVFQVLFLLCRYSERAALRLDLKKTLLIAALPVVIFYLFLAGAAPATLRSVLMISGVVAALSLRREVDPVHGVMLAGCCILFAAPETLFDLSFQLSFLAIWGLIVLAPPLAAPLQRGAKPFRWLMLLVPASAAAILATLVPVAYYFHRLSFIGVVANLAIVPLLGYGAVVAGFVSLPLSSLAPVPAEGLLHVAAFLVRLSDRIIVYLSGAPAWSGYAPTGMDYLISCLILCALTFPRSRRLGLAAACSLALVLVVRAVPATAGDGLLHIHFLSIGQGDATLVQLPDGKWMLIDGGGRAGDSEERVGERLLIPALQRLGARQLDYLVLSHEHPDHLQGVLYLAANFDVMEFWESGATGSSLQYRELKWVLTARGIPVRQLSAATPVQAGGAIVEPLWPVSTRTDPSDDANETSLVFRLSHGQSSVLFTGDLGAEAEQELLERGVPLRSTLLKVGHHGSRYASSDTFLTAVAPSVAVISAGYHNPFGLPSPVTLMRLQRHGIRVYRTDLEGSIDAVCTPGGAVSVATPWGHFN